MARFADVAETHSGVVFFVGDRAYKLKKRVNLGFLDFTERNTREVICHREVELNKRLAADVYLGVADLVGPAGEVEDHLVVMRRLPDERRLSSLVTADEADVGEHLTTIARRLAAFHSEAPTGTEIDSAASAETTLARWQTSAAEILQLHTNELVPAEVSRATDRARRYLEGRGALFDARIAAGKARDGHGDLLADDIFCLDDGPRILDCIEFDDQLRFGDVLSDVAFLAMDLERLGRPDLSRRFLDAYRNLSAGSWPPSLEHHHIAYRAFVRAKVSALRADQEGKDKAPQARELLAMTLAHLDKGRIRLILIGGLPGSGKTTLASAVADALGAVRLSSDETRKQQAGLDTTVPAGANYDEGIYKPEMTLATYQQLFERARVALSQGFSVVIDASFHDPAARAQALRVADSTWADLDQVHCVATLPVIEERIVKRTAEQPGPSDASVAVARAMHAAEGLWPSALEVDTSGSVETVRRDALTRLQITT